MKKFAILVDSGTDLPMEFQKKYSIYMAPLLVVYHDRTYQDGVDISSEEVCKRLKEEIPKTSLPTGYTIVELLKKIENDGYTEVLVITISSNLSGTFNMMNLVASDFPQLAFSFIDSKNIGLGSGVQVLLAAQLQEQGYSREETAQIVERNIPNSKLFFCIPTLDYLRKGGRIGLVASFLGTTLGLKPIISCNEDGIYQTVAKARGWERALETAIAKCVAVAGDNTHYSIGVAYSTTKKEAKAMLKQLSKHLPHAKEKFLWPISPALTVHTGPGLIGFSIQKLDPILPH